MLRGRPNGTTGSNDVTKLGAASHSPVSARHRRRPRRGTRTQNVGEVRTSDGQVFQFHPLPARYFRKSAEDERRLLQQRWLFAIARPKVAERYWLHLTSTKLCPSAGVDFGVLDVTHMQTLADEKGPAEEVEE